MARPRQESTVRHKAVTSRSFESHSAQNERFERAPRNTGIDLVGDRP